MLIDTRQFGARQVLGATLLDLPRILPRLAGRRGWERVCNRDDRPAVSADDPGVRFASRWSSSLHACRVFPWLGAWLMQRAFAQWPVHFAEAVTAGTPEEAPQLTFILPFRGRERLPQLRAVAASILAQRGVRVECLVIEQAQVAEARGQLPPAVSYLHLPHPLGDTAWRKSWAFNVAAAAARAEVLVCHDADILVPADYGSAILATLARGFDSVHIQRFLFYLSEPDTARVLAARRLKGCEPLEVLQNWQGGTLAIRRQSFDAIGGFDERFVAWGGEDNEFFDRCMALRNCRFGFLPFVHLWHTPQASRFGPGRDEALATMNARLVIPAAQRIAELVHKRGALAGARGLA